MAAKAVDGLLTMLNKGEALNEQNVRYVMSLVREGGEEKLTALWNDCITITAKGKPVKPKTLGQKNYAEAIRDNTVVLGIGPAGTGKTYLAVAMAVKAFRAHEVNRIILTRPAVEAGEKLGFLPGDLQNKVRPVSPPAVRRAVRHAGCGELPEISGARQHRSGAFGIHARAHAGRFVYHSGRGAKHHAGADENVFNPAGL